ncbi:helix-turn-helix domain-containing protein [Streptomyces sp. NPDC051940]|uniref:helix-turn-helix domain-containing protein n=1 Tax=Streptomyces sp. NPDC051940 TaxID=3155675 RepID=UPI0034255FB1
MSESWTIGELAEHAARELSADVDSGAPNGRVREVPNERLIRWYATIGLVDPPLTRRGRVALYGRRHLLQLVAVKRLQIQGLSIAEIQAMLAGATDAQLQAVAQLRSDAEVESTAQALPDTPPADSTASPAREPSQRGRFWAADARPRGSAAAEAELDMADGPVAWSYAPSVQPAVRLAPGVTLLLTEAGPGRPADDDLAAISEAAAPLLAALRRRGLLPDAALDITPGPARTDSERSAR